MTPAASETQRHDWQPIVASRFLPEPDPLREFPAASEFVALDDLGRDLPSLLHDKGFRAIARAMVIPPLPKTSIPLEELRLYYVRLGFLASAYFNQDGQDPATILPRNLAIPLCDVCARLGRPPILSYDGYAIFNWKRFDPSGPIALGNIDAIQNFVHLYDEHWFILVHVEIEALAAKTLQAIDAAEDALTLGDQSSLDQALASLAQALWA
jgi:indoleamine 2,3-dioxygenase